MTATNPTAALFVKEQKDAEDKEEKYLHHFDYQHQQS